MTTVETLLNDPDTEGAWNLVPDRSTITFKIKNMWGLISVKGRFTEFTADGQVTGKGAIFGRLDIQVASLRTGIGKRDDHLRSADFFDVERFPEIGVVVTAVQPTTGNAADLQATFSIKGVTAPVPLPVQITLLDDGSVRLSAKTEIDRAQFNLDWNRVGMVGETATVSADVCFVRAQR
ncbi:MAG: YceI family protein [Mycobacterium sp.]|uniref:YceI family protein n=1 Tax=Mycobacterium sp. TaxID=1785 RepID=UPI003BAEDA7D